MFLASNRCFWLKCISIILFSPDKGDTGEKYAHIKHKPKQSKINMSVDFDVRDIIWREAMF